MSYRGGNISGRVETEDERSKREDKERKKAEVRRRLEEEAKAAKGKKGFLTPERKKKLRVLLRRKAAEELKREQERRAEERKRIIRERTGHPKHEDARNEAALIKICKEYHERIAQLLDINWDLADEVRQREMTLNEMNATVSNGRFIKPQLRKVSKYDQKLEKMKQVARQAMDLRGTLKKVKSGIFKLDEDESNKSSTTTTPTTPTTNNKSLIQNSDLDQEIEIEGEAETTEA